MSQDQFRPADHPNEHFLLTTVVGSYPKPKWLNEARDHYEDGSFSEENWKEATNDAKWLIVKEHEKSGLDVVTDGEMGRREMVEYFYHRTDGAEFPGRVKVWGHNYFDKPAVVGDVSRSENWLTDEYELVSAFADRPVKVPITGPYTLAKFSFNEAYDDDRELALALSELVNEEMKLLYEQGARYIQIDEPGLPITPEDYGIVQQCLEIVTEGIPDEVRIGLHVCYGDYSKIYPNLLDYPIDEFDLELANGDYSQLDVFKEPEFTMDFAPGVVDAHTSEVETVEEIKTNIKRGLEVVPPEKLVVSPDCGLKLLSRLVAYQKMENMVEAAREVEAELDAGEIDLDAPLSN